MKTITRKQLTDIITRLTNLRNDAGVDSHGSVVTQLVEDADLMATVLTVLFQKIDVIDSLAQGFVELVEKEHTDILPVSADNVTSAGIGYLRAGYAYGLFEALDYLAAPEIGDTELDPSND